MNMKKLILAVSVGFFFSAMVGAGEEIAVVPLTAGEVPRVNLIVQAPERAGLFRFQLVFGETRWVEALIQAGDTAAMKASRIRAAVASPDGNWRALGQGASINFQYRLGDEWQDVTTLLKLTDTSGGAVTFDTAHLAMLFTFEISPGTVVAGVDGQGAASHLTFSIAGCGAPSTLILWPGMPASKIIDHVSAYLETAGEGIRTLRASPTKLEIDSRYRFSYLSSQTSDAGLQPGIVLGAEPSMIQSGLIDR